MLVFGRKVDECVDLVTPEGLVITVTVVAIRGKGCRIGFSAPLDVSIVRREVPDARPRLKSAKKPTLNPTPASMPAVPSVK